MKLLATFLILTTLVLAADPLPQRREQLKTLLAQEWERDLERHPEMATHAGDYRFNDKLSDYSAAAALAEIEHARVILPSFEAIDTTGFPPREILNKLLKVRTLQHTIEAARFKDWLMPVTQFNGIHLNVASLPSGIPLRSQKDFADYLARLRETPRVFSQVTANMRQGMKDGLMPPRYLLEKVAVQSADIAANTPENSPFAKPLQHLPASLSAEEQAIVKEQIYAAIREQVTPAYKKFAEFVRAEYAPKGQPELGAWALPDGAERYAFAIRTMTTTDLTANQIHQAGLKQVTEIERDMLKVAQHEGFKDLKTFNEHIRADRHFYATSGQQILSLYQHYTDLSRAQLPKLFGTLPKNKLIVVPMETYRQADGVPADYSIGAGDNSLPGRINVNEYKPQERLLLNVEAIAYHEGLPGHHLQFSIAQQLTDLPPFRKFGLRYNAYTEGWGLYSEQLGKEVGLYTDIYSEYGRLQNEMWRAVRLVVDTGVHSKHWTRDRMIAYFHDHTAMDEQNIQTEVDRYISWPAQALSYKLGQMKIVELRERAKRQLGAKFDIRAFHDAILDSGPLPLDILDQKITAWLSVQSH
jgi:uncharacterized protein (DUF885 family)